MQNSEEPASERLLDQNTTLADVTGEIEGAPFCFLLEAHGERMFFFNTCSRVDFYQHDVRHVAGVDRCYDCAAEAHILTCYLTAIARHDARDAHLSQAIARMMHEISCNISWGRTLDSVVDKRSRMEWYEPRRFDTDACQLVCKDVEGGGCED